MFTGLANIPFSYVLSRCYSFLCKNCPTHLAIPETLFLVRMALDMQISPGPSSSNHLASYRD